MTPPPRLLLIAQEGAARRTYEGALSTVGIPFDAASDIEAFFHAVTHRPYSAILVDIPTKVMALKGHRDLVHGILSRYPVIQLSVERCSGRIRALRLGHPQEADSLGEILKSGVLLPIPKVFREHRRQKLHYNVLISESPDIDEKRAIRSVTLDLSEGGCFLFYAGDRYLPDTLWIRLLELSDAVPIGVSVRRRVPWGSGMRLPGIGVRFETLSERQQEEMAGICWPDRSRPQAGMTGEPERLPMQIQEPGEDSNGCQIHQPVSDRRRESFPNDDRCAVQRRQPATQEKP